MSNDVLDGHKRGQTTKKIVNCPLSVSLAQQQSVTFVPMVKLIISHHHQDNMFSNSMQQRPSRRWLACTMAK